MCGLLGVVVAGTRSYFARTVQDSGSLSHQASSTELICAADVMQSEKERRSADKKAKRNKIRLRPCRDGPFPYLNVPFLSERTTNFEKMRSSNGDGDPSLLHPANMGGQKRHGKEELAIKLRLNPARVIKRLADVRLMSLFKYKPFFKIKVLNFRWIWKKTFIFIFNNFFLSLTSYISNF